MLIVDTVVWAEFFVQLYQMCMSAHELICAEFGTAAAVEQPERHALSF